MNENSKKLYVADPIGFCNGVSHAWKLFNEIASAHEGETIYVLHELVHNSNVTAAMRSRGAMFVDSIEEIPEESVALFGAHGVGSVQERAARERRLQVYDAVCPLVARLQRMVAELPSEMPLVFYGDRAHPEVQGIINRSVAKSLFLVSSAEEVAALPPLDSATLMCQTTRSADDVASIAALLREKVRRLDDRSDICNAVRLRQQAVRDLSRKCDGIIIVSSPHSANGRRMLNIAQACGNCNSWMVEGAGDIESRMIENVHSLGLGAATSTPPDIISDVVGKLEELGFERCNE